MNFFYVSCHKTIKWVITLKKRERNFYIYVSQVSNSTNKKVYILKNHKIDIFHKKYFTSSKKTDIIKYVLFETKESYVMRSFLCLVQIKL